MVSKVLNLNSAFTIVKELPTADGTIDSIYIEGYASTTDVDRSGDVVPQSVWEEGIKNYLKNPIILAQHDYDDPIGRMVEHKTDAKGLWIRGRISAAAECFNLIKDGVLTAFSIGFRILDAEYNSVANVFLVKEIELIEISVVSVPCNQNTVFNLAKAFENAEDLAKFKEQFVPNSGSAKGLEPIAAAKSATQKEFDMNPEELKQLLADTAKSAAAEVTKALAEVKALDDKVAKEKSDAEAALEARISAAVETRVKTVDTGAERLLADVTKRFEEQSTSAKSVLEGLEAAIKEKTDELARVQSSKMQFTDKGGRDDVDYQDREKAVLLSKILGKSLQDTKFGSSLIEKAGPHVPSATWELEVSMTMENEVRRRLVVSPTLRQIAMQTNVMTIPINPEAGHATWIDNVDFGNASGASAGGTSAGVDRGSPHQLKEITLNAYKIATKEYMAFEEEEDSLIVLLPIIRDAMVRRTSRGVDRAFLRGLGNGTTDPVKGLVSYDTTSQATSPVGTKVNIAKMMELRRDMGSWGLDPAEVVYVVSTDVYYDLLEDTLFQTMDKVGTKASVLTGQIGMISGSPVLVSAEFPVKAAGLATATTNYAAVAYAPGNFLVGNQRGLRIDTQDLVESQRKVLVASLRTGMTQVTSNLGLGLSALRWVA